MRSATRHFWTTGTDPSPSPIGSRVSLAGMKTASSSMTARLSRTGHSGAGTTWTPREGAPATSYARLTSELANHLLHVPDCHLNGHFDWHTCYWHTCICQIDLLNGVMIGEPATSYFILIFELSFRLSHMLLHMPDWHLNCRSYWHTCYFICQIDIWTVVSIDTHATSYARLTFELSFRLTRILLHMPVHFIW